MRAFLAGVAFLLIATQAHAQTPEALAAVERAAATGARIFAHDQAAWYGTDTMIADIGDPRALGFRGWITEDAPDGGVVLLFVRPEGEALFAAYRVLYRDGEVRETQRINTPLTEMQTRLYRARQIAVDALQGHYCGSGYNTVTLPRAEPGADGADIDVYVMRPFESFQRLPLGGNYRVAIDSASGAVRGFSGYAPGCDTLDVEANSPRAMIWQVVGDTPTEMQVFISLTTHLHLSVVSHSGTWSVDGGAITYLNDTHN